MYNPFDYVSATKAEINMIWLEAVQYAIDRRAYVTGGHTLKVMTMADSSYVELVIEHCDDSYIIRVYDHKDNCIARFVQSD